MTRLRPPLAAASLALLLAGLLATSVSEPLAAQEEDAEAHLEFDVELLEEGGSGFVNAETLELRTTYTRVLGDGPVEIDGEPVGLFRTFSGSVQVRVESPDFAPTLTGLYEHFDGLRHKHDDNPDAGSEATLTFGVDDSILLGVRAGDDRTGAYTITAIPCWVVSRPFYSSSFIPVCLEDHDPELELDLRVLRAYWDRRDNDPTPVEPGLVLEGDLEKPEYDFLQTADVRALDFAPVWPGATTVTVESDDFAPHLTVLKLVGDEVERPRDPNEDGDGRASLRVQQPGVVLVVVRSLDDRVGSYRLTVSEAGAG